MKIKKFKNIKRSKPTMRMLEEIISTHERMQGCYFWTPPSSASQRRQYENRYSNQIRFELNGVDYDIVQATDCSCANIYYTLKIHVDGAKKDVRALRRLVK